MNYYVLFIFLTVGAMGGIAMEVRIGDVPNPFLFFDTKVFIVLITFCIHNICFHTWYLPESIW